MSSPAEPDQPDPDSEPSAVSADARPELHLRARHILRVPKIWILPLTIATIFVAAMSAIYMGSIVNPTGHLRGLPVRVVNEDSGAIVHGRNFNIGDDVVQDLYGSSAVTSRLKLSSGTLAQAHTRMDQAGAYATIVIPSSFTQSVLVAGGAERASTRVPSEAAVGLLENERLGSIGVNLAAGVTGDAVAQIATALGHQLAVELVPSVSSTKAQLERETIAEHVRGAITVAPSDYRPLPDHTGLGLSAFYTALLAMMAGFLGAMLIHNSVDSALGFATMDIGPRWRQAQPKRINRLHTLLVKFCLVAFAAPILTGMLMLVAVTALHMYAPDWLLLWALLALAAMMIGAGTLALLAAFGSLGQLLAMIVLIYLSLGSSGGTIPVQALPGILRFVSHVEPLRQILDGVRATLYFNARGDAGLTSSLIVVTSELVFWTLFGLGFTAWYDHRKLYRVSPEILSFVEGALEERAAKQAGDSE